MFPMSNSRRETHRKFRVLQQVEETVDDSRSRQYLDWLGKFSLVLTGL